MKEENKMSVNELTLKFKQNMDQLDKLGNEINLKINSLKQQFSGISKLLEDLQNEKKRLRKEVRMYQLNTLKKDLVKKLIDGKNEIPKNI